MRCHVREITDRFSVQTVYTRVGHSPRQGLAADFMTYTNKAKGDAIVAYVLANARRLDVQYVCWYGRYITPGGVNRPGCVGAHRDHPHVSFLER